MAAKKKTTKKVDIKEDKSASLEVPVEVAVPPKGDEGKARWKGVPLEDYAQKVVACTPKKPIEILARVEKALLNQGYDPKDVSEYLPKLKELLVE